VVTARIEVLATSATGDESLVEQLAQLINDAYAVGEKGLWIEGTKRTTSAEVAEVIGDEGMLTATLEGQAVGCASVRAIDASTADLGVVSVAPDRWGGGFGRELVRSAEDLMRSRAVTTSQLELLVPREWVHPEKDRLRRWYLRLGYRIVRTAQFEEIVPARLTGQLATPCEFLVFRKDLSSAVR
jgi:GNAT superfamily N-acetyltransferase